MNNLRLPLTSHVRNYSGICVNTPFVSLQKPVPVVGIASKILYKNYLVPDTPAFAFIQNQHIKPTCSLIFQKQLNMKHQFSIIAAPFHTSSSLRHGRKFAVERRQKKAAKNKALKIARHAKTTLPIPYKVQLMLASKGLGGPPRHIREKDDKEFSADDVYFIEDAAWKRWKFEEAIKELRLCNHPSMGFSKPEGLVFAKIEFNLKSNKRDQYMDGFTKMVPITHAYDRGVPDRSICAFVTDDEMANAAMEAGAVKTGGEEFIKELAKGRIDVSDIDHFVAHEDILGSVNTLVGVLRDKAPRPREGTVGTDVPSLVATWCRGMDVTVKKVKPSLGYIEEPDYGFCEASIGKLDMDVDKLEANLTALLEALNEQRPMKRKDKDETFITRCILKVEGKNFKGQEFSIIHPTVLDKRVDEQNKVITEGRKIISERVSMLKAKQN